MQVILTARPCNVRPELRASRARADGERMAFKLARLDRRADRSTSQEEHMTDSTGTRKRDAVALAACALLHLSTACAAAPPNGAPMSAATPGAVDIVDHHFALITQFEAQGVAIEAVERERLSQMMAAARRHFQDRRVCAVVVGHSGVYEGSLRQQETLAEARASNVARLLEIRGFEKSQVRTQSVSSRQRIADASSPKNSRAEVEFYRCRSHDCPREQKIPASLIPV